jgi:hypothetical protein
MRDEYKKSETESLLDTFSDLTKYVKFTDESSSIKKIEDGKLQISIDIN